MGFQVEQDGAVKGKIDSELDAIIPEGAIYVDRTLVYPFGDSQVRSLYLPKSFLGYIAGPYEDADFVYNPESKSVSLIADNALKLPIKDKGIISMRYMCQVHFNSLESFIVHEDNPVYATYNGLLYTKDYSCLLLCPENIEGELVLHGNTTKIAPQAFYNCQKISSVVLPHKFTSFSDECFDVYFQNMSEPFTIIGGNVRELKEFGSQAMCTKYSALVYATLVFPQIDLSSVNKFYKLRLAIGYCSHQYLYSKEMSKKYERFLSNNRSEILSLVHKLNAKETIAYYDEQDGKKDKGTPLVKSTERTKSKLKKLSPRKATSLLEEAVCFGTLEDVDDVLKSQKQFTYTARALGLAGRYGSLDKVKLLVQAGCRFDYDDVKPVNNTYFGNWIINNDISYRILANQVLLIVADKFRKPIVGEGLQLPLDRNGCLAKAKVLPAKERIEIIAYLCKQGLINKQDRDALYFHALVFAEFEIADYLLKHGASLEPYSDFFNTLSRGWWRLAVLDIIFTEIPEAAPAMAEAALKDGFELVITNIIDLEEFIENPELLKKLLTYAKMQSNTFSSMVKGIIANNQCAAMQALLDIGRIKKGMPLNMYIQEAVDLGASEMVAMLLNFKEKQGINAKQKGKSGLYL